MIYKVNNNVLEDKIIEDFNYYSTEIVIDLRDSEYNQTTKKNINELWNAFEKMEVFYSNRGVIHADSVFNLKYCPIQIDACKYNIAKEKENIENIAKKFWKHIHKLLGENLGFVDDERDLFILDEKYEEILKLEKMCWNSSCGEQGFISECKATQELNYEQIDIFIETINKIVSLSKELKYYSKNTVRILCNVNLYYYIMQDIQFEDDKAGDYLYRIYRSI